jgi:sensor histidine kinase YesM
MRAAALEHQLIKARLNTLQTQLHPHFLFNALNAISTLMRRDPRAAHDTLMSFSELLRMALGHSSRLEVPLSEDLAFLRRYVEIQQLRLGDRFHFEELIPTEFLEVLVPTLLLQPLVENAIQHGIDPSPGPGTVRVIVEAAGEKLRVIVEDNGVGLSSEEGRRTKGTGIGLGNLRQRLESLYGSSHRFEYGLRETGGVVVRVEIPLRPSHVNEMLPAGS